MAPPLSSRSSNCFGGIVFTHLAREVRTIEQAVGKEELLVCGHRLFRAITVIQEASVAHFLQRMRVKLAQREERLRGFNRALTHEFKNQIGALLGAADLLDLSGVADAERSRVADIVRRNATAMRTTLDNLVELSRVEREVRQHRWVMLPEAVAEAVRHLRDTAAHAGVEIRVCRLPAIEVPAAAVELAVANYLTNAVKYRDPAASRSWVDVRGRTAQSGPNLPPEIVIEVWDNGLGVPSPMRSQLFARGFRAHEETVTGAEGMGLGLSLVKDAVESLGGRVWATFPETGGSCFALALPARRASDGPSGAQLGG